MHIRLSQIKSKKQMKEIDSKKVISAKFTEESRKEFVITFDCENGEFIDLLISFETRSPHIYISSKYKKQEEV